MKPKRFVQWVGCAPPKFVVLPPARAVALGFSPDRRKRRHQHRVQAASLLKEGSSILNSVAFWHLYQARHL